MQRIRKISNLFKKPEEPNPDDFLDVSISRWDRDHDKAKKQLKQLKHVKSMPLRTNKPTYRGGQRVPKEQIVYPLIPIAHHVDILESRPSTSSYDTYNSEPLDLLPPPSLKQQEYTKQVLEAEKVQRQRERNKPLPPSPHRAQEYQYATTHGYTRQSASRPTPVRATPTAKSSAPSSAPRREVAKPVPRVTLPSRNAHLKEIPTAPSPATNQRKVDYNRLGPPTAKFTMFKPIDRGVETPKTDNVPAHSPSTIASPHQHTTAAVPAKPSRPCVFSYTDSDDSLSVYSDEFSVDSVSVMTNEEPRKIPYVRYHDARTGDEDRDRRAAVNSVDKLGIRQGSHPQDADRSISTSSSSLRRQLAIRRTGSSGSPVYQSDSVHPSNGKSSYAQDMLSRAHKAAAVAGLRASPASPKPQATAGSNHTKVHMMPARPPPKQPIPGSVEDFRSRPLEAGIPFPSAVLQAQTVSPSAAPTALSHSQHASQSPQRQYYDPMYFSSSSQQQPGFQIKEPRRTRDRPTQSPSGQPSAMQSTPPPQSRPISPKLRDVPQATIRPLNPHKHAHTPATSSRARPSATLHPPALQQSLAKHSVQVSVATGAGKRKSCKAEVVASEGMTQKDMLELALHEPEIVVPVPKVDPKYQKTSGPSHSRSQGKGQRKY